MGEACAPEQREACPLRKCFTDTHHLAYPASDYKTAVEKKWRELPANKVELCRFLHNSIHASGYFPPKPDRDEMMSEIWPEEPSDRAELEKTKQLFLGKLVMERPEGVV